MQTKKLKEITEIISGYTFRTAVKNSPKGNTFVLFAKDIALDGTINTFELTSSNLPLLKTSSFTLNKDIILSSRGSFRAGILHDNRKNIIAASSVYILRIKTSKILPEFILTLLNSKIGQNSLQKIVTGTTIKTILKKDLEELEIPIPKIQDQQTIIQIEKNWKNRENLLNKKISINQKISEATIKKLLTS